MTLRIFSSLSFYCILKWATYLHLATEMQEKEAGGRNETIKKTAQDNPLLWAFLLWYMFMFSRVQHIEVDCFGCSWSWFLAPILASGVPGRVHPLPSAQAQLRGAHQHHMPSKKLILCWAHRGNWEQLKNVIKRGQGGRNQTKYIVSHKYMTKFCKISEDFSSIIPRTELF